MFAFLFMLCTPAGCNSHMYETKTLKQCEKLRWGVAQKNLGKGDMQISSCLPVTED